MNKLKFNLDYLPSNAHYNNLRYFVKKDVWNEIVKNIREYKKYECEFCHKKFDKTKTSSLKYLHCHESWMFDYENQRQILLDILLLCNNCHNCQHINFASLKDYEEKALNHFRKINNLEMYEFNELKREGMLFRKNYFGNKLISKKQLDEVPIWFFKNECQIDKYFSNNKELGELILKLLNNISDMNF